MADDDKKRYETELQRYNGQPQAPSPAAATTTTGATRHSEAEAEAATGLVQAAGSVASALPAPFTVIGSPPSSSASSAPFTELGSAAAAHVTAHKPAAELQAHI